MSEGPGSSGGGDLTTEPLGSLIEVETRRRICTGKLLLRIRLACDEVASLTEPAPLFRLVPRLAYLPFFFNDVFENFKSCMAPPLGQSYEIWFDYNGAPLRWHLPLGVLCDMLVGSEVPIPLDMTVHFRGFPSKDLLPFSGIGDLKGAVMSAWRQSVYLQHSSATPWSRLPMQQQQKLWDTIKAANMEGCSEVQEQLLCPSLAKCKSLAVRIHVCGVEPALTHDALLHPAPPLTTADSQPVTMHAFLRQVLPPLFPKAEGEVVPEELVEGVEVLSHSLRLPLETPMYWLALHASHLDNFLHLIVRLQSTGSFGSSSPAAGEEACSTTTS